MMSIKNYQRELKYWVQNKASTAIHGRVPKFTIELIQDNDPGEDLWLLIVWPQHV